MAELPKLHLASSSPRRREILTALRLEFTMQAVALDEYRLDGESPRAMVSRLATAKAAAANAGEGQSVLGADTAVVLDDRVLGKPRDAGDAVEMLMALSGRQHTVLTGVALRTAEASDLVVSSTDVVFREIDRDEAHRYWQSGEPCDKAGAYGIQGLGGVFVEAITGSYSGVVGLPVFETVGLLRRAGIDVLGPVNKK